MQNIQLNIFDVDVPALGGLCRNIYNINSPIKDYSFHLSECLVSEVDKFIKNIKFILSQGEFLTSDTIELSFDKMMKMPVESKQETFTHLDENQQTEVLKILSKNFPDYQIVVVTCT